VSASGVDRAEVQAVGIGAPGPMNWQTGVVYSPPNLPGWDNVPLAGLMKERLGAPVFVDNDANVACFGEFWQGAGRDVDSMVLLTLGTGVGGGIVVMGKLLRGPDGTAAEIGHLCVKRNGRQCNCGAKGCLEQYASVTGMLKTAVKGINEGHDTILTDLCGGDLDQLTGKMISEAIERGDGFAAWVMEETGVWLGTSIGSLVNLLNPEMVVLGGGMIAAGDVLFQPIRETAANQSFDVPGQRAEIIPAQLGNDAGTIGAAGCALERLQG
jgi:glucokinase